MMMLLRWVRGLVILTLLLAPIAYADADADTDSRLETSRQFATDFMARSFDKVMDRYTAQVKAGLPEETANGIVGQLTTANGPVVQIGEPWFEDKVGIHRRYRVPIVFEKATLDMRIVYDAEDRVAGLFFVPHTEPTPVGTSPGTEIDITVGGLPGTLTLPKGNGPFPAVILVHGSGPNDRDETLGPNKPFRDIAWGLAERGIATLRYDKRSYVSPQDLVQVGEALTVREEVINDARAGLDLLRRHPDIDNEAIYVVGHSLGGNLAPRIAAVDPHPTGVIVLAGSTLPLPEKMLEQQRFIRSLDGLSPEDQTAIDEVAAEVALIRAAIDGEKTVSGYHLGAPIGYYQDLEDHDPPRILAELGLPCLVLQGGRDYQVTLEDFAVWEETLAGQEQACLRVFDSLDHLMREGTGPSTPSDYDVAAPVSAALIDCMADWILKRDCCRE
jgi:dienelactone hydrolase